MTERMDIDAIVARAEATPEGPWAADHGELGSDVYRLHDGGPLIADLSPELAEFIAAARTDVLEMAAELRAVRHQLHQTTERERAWVGMAVAMAEQSMPAVPVAPVVTEDKDAHRWDVLAEVNAERVRQDAKWGEQNHPDVDPDMAEYTPATVANFYGIPTAERAKELCDTAAKEEGCTWAHILVEEVAEAVDAACQVRQGVDIDALRNELLQVAAVAVSWIEAIDRRGVAK